jgi:hypothetical protein
MQSVRAGRVASTLGDLCAFRERKQNRLCIGRSCGAALDQIDDPSEQARFVPSVRNAALGAQVFAANVTITGMGRGSPDDQ